MKKIAYVRVSTPDQRHDRQIEGLSAFCDALHVETLSACAAKRPVYDHVLSMLKPGDMLVVWDLDRAFRSVIDALTEAEKLRARGIHFRIANLHIDTSTPAGIFVYTMLSALAEFERRTLSQRTKEGLSDTFAYIAHFLPIAAIAAVVELMFPIALWAYTFWGLAWGKYREEFRGQEQGPRVEAATTNAEWTPGPDFDAGVKPPAAGAHRRGRNGYGPRDRGSNPDT